MAVLQLLVMYPDRRPKMAEVIQAASADDFSPHETDLESHSGFLPIAIGSRQTGFEYYYQPLEAGSVPDQALKFGSHAMIARTGGDFLEMYASLLFFRVAAKLADAAYAYPDDAIVLPPEEVESYLSDQLQLIKNYLR
jgi:hypothetical protein